MQVLTYMTTVATTYFAIGAILLLGLDALTEQLEAAVAHPVSRALIALAEASMLIWSLVDGHLEKRDPTRASRRKSRLPASSRIGLAALVALGAVVTVVEFATAAPYLAAIGALTAHGVPVTVGLPLLAGYVGVMSLPPLILLLAHGLLGDRISGRLQRWYEKVVASSRATAQWIVGIVGVMLIRYGAGALAQLLG